MAETIIAVAIILAVLTAAVIFVRRVGRSSRTTSSRAPLRPSQSGSQNRTSSGNGTNIRIRTPPTETEIMNYFANARHGQTDNWFSFQYKRVGSEWRAYIIRMPSLNGRSSDCHSTHRYHDANGNHWICRSPQPTNLKDCQAISKAWADRLLEYIATGVEANSQRW